MRSKKIQLQLRFKSRIGFIVLYYIPYCVVCNLNYLVYMYRSKLYPNQSSRVIILLLLLCVLFVIFFSLITFYLSVMSPLIRRCRAIDLQAQLGLMNSFGEANRRQPYYLGIPLTNGGLHCYGAGHPSMMYTFAEYSQNAGNWSVTIFIHAYIQSRLAFVQCSLSASIKLCNVMT